MAGTNGEKVIENLMYAYGQRQLNIANSIIFAFSIFNGWMNILVEYIMKGKGSSHYDHDSRQLSPPPPPPLPPPPWRSPIRAHKWGGHMPIHIAWTETSLRLHLYTHSYTRRLNVKQCQTRGGGTGRIFLPTPRSSSCIQEETLKTPYIYVWYVW